MLKSYLIQVSNFTTKLLTWNLYISIPVPRCKKADSPPPPKKFDLPPATLPQRSYTVSSRPMSTISSEVKQPTLLSRDISCNNLARVKPEIPKGKKPVLKAKPAIEGTQIKR